MANRGRHVRRGAPRFELDEELHGRTQHHTEIQLVDLSTSGALIEHHRFLKAGTDLTLEIPVGAPEPLKVSGNVIHSAYHRTQSGAGGQPERAVYRAGVRFRDLSDSGRQAIRELILERLRSERREQPRLYVGASAHIEENVEIRAVNLGPRGGLFSVRHPLEYNSEHDFVFELPGGTVRGRGVVRHCQAWAQSEGHPVFQIGVEFTSFHPGCEQIVADYLAALERAEEPRKP